MKSCLPTVATLATLLLYLGGATVLAEISPLAACVWLLASAFYSRI